ncbi:MAG: exodeoxyribonuclease VII small subunit [Tetrasphaera sp.]|nr:exodeoxyribonuclease VII small subunit [Tetrasphaera sp.]
MSDTAAPEERVPDTATPDTATPDTQAPDTATPDTAAAETAKPDTGIPDTAPPSAPAPPPAADGVAALTYEQARDELVGIVARLEGGQVGLEESMTLWQRGEALAAHCTRWLDAAEQTLREGPATAVGSAD